MTVITVEVVYASATEQSLLEVQVAKGTTVGEAISRSGILERHRDIDLRQNAVGIFSIRVSLNCTLDEDTRVEIYRPLIADPKTSRKLRARRAKGNKRVAGG